MGRKTKKFKRKKASKPNGSAAPRQEKHGGDVAASHSHTPFLEPHSLFDMPVPDLASVDNPMEYDCHCPDCRVSRLASSFIRSLPSELTRVCVSLVQIHEELLRITGIPLETYAEAILRSNNAGSALRANVAAFASEIASGLGGMTTPEALAEAAAAAIVGEIPESELPQGARRAEIEALAAAAANELALECYDEDAAELSTGPRHVPAAEALEASIMAAMPHDIAESVYDCLEIMGCPCPVPGCGESFAIDDLETHCLLHLEEDEDDDDEINSMASKESDHRTVPARQTDDFSDLSNPLAKPAFVADIPDDVLLDEPEDRDDIMASLSDDSLFPEMTFEDFRVSLILPRRTIEIAPIDVQWEILTDWLYGDDVQSNVERWERFLPTLRAINKRIAALTPLIDAKQQVLSIRAQVTADYHKKLRSMPGAVDQETHRIRNHMVEILCLASAICNYLEITRRRIAVFKQDLQSVSSLAKRMQDSIADLSVQVDAHRKEVEKIHQLEVKTLKEEMFMLHEKKLSSLSSLDSESYQQQKEVLMRKIDQCNHKIGSLREKYQRTLRILVRTREKLSAQEHMESSLKTLQSQCHTVLSNSGGPDFPRALFENLQAREAMSSAAADAPPQQTNTTSEPAPATAESSAPASSPALSSSDGQQQSRDKGAKRPAVPLHSINLQPIIAFEKQEDDDLKRLVEEHAAKAEERAQIFDLIREAAYTDPIIRVVKSCFRQALQRAVVTHRRALRQAELVMRKGEQERSDAIAQDLILAEEQAQKREREKQIQKQQAEEKRRIEREKAEKIAQQQQRAQQRAEAKKRAEQERLAQEREQQKRQEAEKAIEATEAAARQLFASLKNQQDEEREKSEKARAQERQAREKAQQAKAKELAKTKEKQAKEKQARDKQVLERQAKQKQEKERLAKAQQLKMQQAQQAKEKQAKEKQAKEQQAKEQQAKQRQAKQLSSSRSSQPESSASAVAQARGQTPGQTLSPRTFSYSAPDAKEYHSQAASSTQAQGSFSSTAAAEMDDANQRASNRRRSRRSRRPGDDIPHQASAPHQHMHASSSSMLSTGYATSSPREQVMHSPRSPHAAHNTQPNGYRFMSYTASPQSGHTPTSSSSQQASSSFKPFTSTSSEHFPLNSAVQKMSLAEPSYSPYMQNHSFADVNPMSASDPSTFHADPFSRRDGRHQAENTFGDQQRVGSFDSSYFPSSYSSHRSLDTPSSHFQTSTSSHAANSLPPQTETSSFSSYHRHADAFGSQSATYSEPSGWQYDNQAKFDSHYRAQYADQEQPQDGWGSVMQKSASVQSAWPSTYESDSLSGHGNTGMSYMGSNHPWSSLGMTTESTYGNSFHQDMNQHGDSDQGLLPDDLELERETVRLLES